MKAFLRPMLALGIALLSGSALSQQPWRIYPPSPTAGEPFVIQYDGVTAGGPASVRSATLSMEGSTLVYKVDVQESDFSVPGAYRASTAMPGIAAGQYPLQLQRTGGFPGNLTAMLGTIQVAAAQAPAQPAFRRLSGNWFDPSEPGWGMNIVQGDSGALFIAWLTYWPLFGNDTVNTTTGMWLVMPEGRWLSPTLFRGLIYSTAGTTASMPFDRTQLSVKPVGYVSIDFSSATQASVKAEAGLADTHSSFFQSLPFNKEATVRRFQF